MGFSAQVILNWDDNSNDELGFKIERALADLVFTEIAKVGPNITTYTDATLTASTVYAYRVSAFNASGASGFTNLVTTDGGTSTIAILPTNTPPSISDIKEQAVVQGNSTGALSFTVADAETSPGVLSLSGASSNPTLVPAAGIVFGGTGSTRTVTVSPAANQSGTAIITVTVSDGALTATNSFVVTVSPANTAPTISDIVNQSIGEDAKTGPLAFTIYDAQTAADSLMVTATSSNPALVPNSAIVLGGTGPNRTVDITPLANQNGTTVITVTVSDGILTAGDAFTLNVVPINDAPTITAIPDQVIEQGTATLALSFSVGDVETMAGSLSMSANSSNPLLVPVTAIVFAGSGSNRTATITPAANQAGLATITLTVSDGSTATSTVFDLRVNAASVAAVPLPLPWQDMDIGATAVAGAAHYNNGSFSIEGAGVDISGANDQFHFLFQSATGDCEIVARVATIENTNTQAKAGVMIRESNTAGSRYVAVLVTPGNGARFQARATTSGNTADTRANKVAAPEWVKLRRVGHTFTGYYSSNGTSWTQFGTQTIVMGTSVSFGLAVTSRNSATLCTTTIESVTENQLLHVCCARWNGLGLCGALYFNHDRMVAAATASFGIP
jgi:hypothetical protein